jgi:hypothetical protein
MTTKEQNRRRRTLIRELCELSRDGWQNAKPYDYLPLERELKSIGSRD